MTSTLDDLIATRCWLPLTMRGTLLTVPRRSRLIDDGATVRSAGSQTPKVTDIYKMGLLIGAVFIRIEWCCCRYEVPQTER